MTWRADQLHLKPSDGIERRDIPGYPGYSATADGRIWSARSQKFLRPTATVHGYEDVRLRGTDLDTDCRTTRTVHRLVAMAWISNPQKLPFVNHLDGNRRHNAVTNLEWCSAHENTQHALKIGLIKNQITPELRAEVLRLKAEGNTWRAVGGMVGRTRDAVISIGKTTARVLERKP